MRVRSLCSAALPLAALLSLSLAACGGSDDPPATGSATPAAAAPTGTKATLAVLETTDLHTNVLSYDYVKLAADSSLGFERVSTLISQARAQFPNTLLLDNGDTIQGTALSDYQALVSPITCDQTLAIYKVMNAAKYIPEMRAKGADLVVAISHGGLDNSTYSPTMENGSWWLSTVPGIDAMLIGHSHQLFPNATSTVAQFNLPGVDKVAGTVNGVPTVMANYWGKHLGVIKLGLTFNGTNWAVDKTQTTVEARSIQNADKTYVAADPTVSAAIATEHQATINYVKTPIGNTDFHMSTYFADVGDPGAIEIVNQAQADYVSTYIQANLPQYASLPVLSVSAPFKSGFGGGTDFTDVAAGPLAINNAADLYLYPNTVYAVKVAGADIKNWLETAAKRFNTIDPTQATVQKLVSTFPGYNFDMFTTPDLTYEIDVTQPVGSRIKNLLYKGVAIDPAGQFIVATNNYRASGGGNFPGLDGSKTIYASPDANRDVLINYIKKIGTVKLATNGSQRSWRFTKLAASVAQVQFSSAPGHLADATAAGINNVTQVAADDGTGKGLAVYQIDLTQ